MPDQPRERAIGVDDAAALFGYPDAFLAVVQQVPGAAGGVKKRNFHYL